MTTFLWNIEGFATKISAPWDEKVQKSRDRLLSKIFSIPKGFELQGSPYEIFWYCEIKTINKNVIPVLSNKFWNQNNSETQAGSPTMTFGDVRQKKFKKLWYPYYLKTFDTRTFLKHRRVRRQCFSASWDKKSSTEKRDTPFLSINFFRTRNFLKDKSVHTRSFSVLWD